MRKFTKKINALSNVGLSILLVGLTLVPILSSTTKKASADTTLPAYNYTKTFDATNGNAYGEYVATDKYNNIYVYGTFNGTVIFNPNDPSTSITAANENTDIFLTKFSNSGIYQWTKTLDTSSGSAYAEGVTTDSDGNVIIYGQLDGTVNLPGANGFSKTTQNSFIAPQIENKAQEFLPKSLRTNITSSDNTSFLIKFDSNGNTLWSNVANSGDGGIDSTSVTTDKNNNIYGAGYFCGTVNFSESISATSANCSNYIAIYNSSGVFQTLKYSDTTNGISNSIDVKVDRNGNIYTVGYFQGQVGFNYDGTNPGSNIFSNPSSDPSSYLTKYSSNGTYEWTKINTAQNNTSIDIETNVAIDSNNNVYTSGFFVGIDSFNQQNTLTSSDSGNGPSNYLSKYDANGNYLWTKITTSQPSSTTMDSFQPGGLVIDPNNDIYTSGYFAGNILLDGPGGSDAYTSANNGNGYISKFNPDGSYDYSKVTTYDSSAEDSINANIYPNKLALDNLGNIYSTGYYYGPVYFNGVNNTDENDTNNNNSFLTSWKAFIPPVTSTTAKTPATGFAKGNNTNQIILYSSIFIALSLITGGYIVNKKSKS